MLTQRTGNRFFATEFKRMAPSETENKSPALHISAHELKQIIEEYDKIKTVGCLNPISEGMKSIKLLYTQLPSKEVNLAKNELIGLTRIIIKIKKHADKHSKTYIAVKNLFDKLKPMIKFIELYSSHFSIEDTFPVICNYPTLADDMEYIFHKIGFKEEVKVLLTQYPKVIALIANSLKNEKFSIDLLDREFWTIIYFNKKQEQAIDIAFANDQMRIIQRSSEKNLQFMIKYGEYAAEIAAIFIILDSGQVIDKEESSDECIRQLLEKDPAQIPTLRRALDILNTHHLINSLDINFVLAICQNLAIAEKLANAAVVLNTNQLLNQENFNLILLNSLAATELVATMIWLKKSFLLEIPGVQNLLYQHAAKIDNNVPAIVEKLFESRLLIINNFTLLFDNLAFSKEINDQLPGSFSQEQFNLVVSMVKTKKITTVKDLTESKELHNLPEIKDEKLLTKNKITLENASDIDDHNLYNRLRRI